MLMQEFTQFIGHWSGRRDLGEKQKCLIEVWKSDARTYLECVGQYVYNSNLVILHSNIYGCLRKT